VVTTAVVAGAIGNKPWNGGNAWTRLSWLLGLARLGLEVRFAELIGEDAPPDADEYLELVLAGHDIERAASTSEIAEADLLVNIGGHLPLEGPLQRIPVKVYFDDDPGYTQIWQASGISGARLEGHDAYYTLGVNIGHAGCTIPTAGIEWRPMLPPTVLAEWPPSDDSGEAFTTVASWRGAYGPVEWEGVTYGVKAHEFRKLAPLPQRVEAPFEIALDIHPADEADRDLLEAGGWRLVDPRAGTATPDDFRRYVQGSLGECSVAQSVYVETASGWFSDRTARYLASGRPALVQDTGVDLPRGEGLVTFTTLEEAVTGAESILADYERHAAGARALAEEFLDSDKVLGRLLEEVLP
jgi:hypothetical protein